MRRQLKQPTAPERSATASSRVAFHKHPIHPMLVVYPIAFLSAVFATDMLHLASGLPFWAQCSYWLNLAGLGLGLVAGAVGTLDMFLMPVTRRHVSAWNHFLAAVMVLALAALGVWWRAPDPVAAVWPWGVLQSAVLLSMVFVAGWLGGTLSFRHGIGVYGEDESGESGGDDSPPAQ
jgi:uncharacterized membrane protein